MLTEAEELELLELERQKASPQTLKRPLGDMIQDGLDVALSPFPQVRTIARTAGNVIRDPAGMSEMAPTAMAASASLINPLLAPPAAMLGKGIEIGMKKIYGDSRSTQPTIPIPLTNIKIPRIPKIPEKVSDVLVEGVMQAPIEATRLLSGAAGKIAPLRAAKAMGATKRFLNTARKIDQAEKTGQIMLDEGVVTSLASSEEMLDRVKKLENASGGRIGEFLKGQKEGIDPNKLVDAIEELRPIKRDPNEILTQIAAEGKSSGGFYDDVDQVLDKAINTIKAHGNKSLDFETANKIKGLLQKINWNSDTLKSTYARKSAGAVRSGIDSELSRIAETSGDTKQFDQFLKDKKVYGASESSKDYLYNALSRELGNRDLGLTDFLTMGAASATGDVKKVGALLGIKKALDKFGNQTTASYANQIAKDHNLLPALIRALMARKAKKDGR